MPVDADLMFDVRCLPNPYFVPTLRPRTGRDRAVVKFMEKDAPTREFMDRLEEYVRFVDSALHRGREELPDHRHRLHRRPPSVGDDRGAAAARPGGHHRRARAGAASGHRVGTMIGVVVVTHGQLAIELSTPPR